MTALVVGPQINVRCRGLHLNASTPGAVGKRSGRARQKWQRQAHRGQPDIWNLGVNHSDGRIRSGTGPAERTAERAIGSQRKATRLGSGRGIALAIEAV